MKWRRKLKIKNWREKRSENCETAERKKYIDENVSWKDECYTYMLEKSVRTYLYNKYI